MTAGNVNRRLAGKVSLSIPMLDPDDPTLETRVPIKGVRVTLITSGKPGEAITDSDGEFVFDHLEPGTYRFCVDPEVTRDNGIRSQQFQITGGDECRWADIPGDEDAYVWGGEFTYAIQPAAVVEDTFAQDRELFINTAHSIAGIEAALKDLSTFPFSGPSGTDGDSAAPAPSTATRRAVATGGGVRSGVTAALESLGLSESISDEDLAQLFPAETDPSGDVTYRFSGPVAATRVAARTNGRKNGAVQVSGTLARFQQRARTSLNEMQEVLAKIQPVSGHDVDPNTLATQKRIVLDTMQSIVDEPARVEGPRTLAVDLQFNSLLDDPIVVERDGTTAAGNLGVLEHLLGISEALITDQDTETHVTEWNRVVDAALSARDAWTRYKDTTSTPQLRFGERLRELYSYFEALSKAADDARAMLRTVRYSPQDQATQKFPTSASGEITTDDLLSMVEELGDKLGPTYIDDWKGRGIATLTGRVTRLADATEDIVNPKNPDGTPKPRPFPFSSHRVQVAFEDIKRLLDETAVLCQKITDDMI